mgnify:CR=1 FL=1
MTDTQASLLAHVRSIADTLENPPMVDADGGLLPEDVVNCESNPSCDAWVTGYDRKIPDADIIWTEPGVFEIEGYSYDPEDDVVACKVTGQVWESFGSGYFWSHEGELILGGEEIADVCPMSGFDYLQDILDIEYRVGSDREYRSAEILVAFGGPNIWIDTKTQTVKGAWWGDHAEASYTDEMGLDGACEELFNC